MVFFQVGNPGQTGQTAARLVKLALRAETGTVLGQVDSSVQRQNVEQKAMHLRLRIATPKPAQVDLAQF